MNKSHFLAVRGGGGGLPAPGVGSAAVDVSLADAAFADDVCMSLYVTGGGNVKFQGLDGTDDTWTVPANFVIPVAMAKVYSSGTTATGLHAIK